MGDTSLFTIILAGLAFFVVGALWYGVLFGKAWQKAAGLDDAEVRSGNMLKIFGLTLLFDLLIATVLAHQFAMTGQRPGVLMISIGFALGVMIPASGSSLYLRKSGALPYRCRALRPGHDRDGRSVRPDELGAHHSWRPLWPSPRSSLRAWARFPR